MKLVKVYTNSTFNDSIEIVSYLKPVTYHIVLGVNFFADWLSSWTDFLGGKSQSYQTRLSAINKEVIEGIQTQVFQLGGNAAIDLKIDNDEISAQGKSMIMVTAIATAVIIKDKITSTSVELPKKGVKAVTNQEFLLYKQRQEFKAQITAAVHIGPLNRLLPEIQSEHYDLIEDLMDTINNGNFNPKDFNKESHDTIRNMINSIDSDFRSEKIYKNLELIIDETTELNYRASKCQFYLYMIETTNCVSYSCINEILSRNSNRFNQDFIDHYIKGLNLKSIYFPGDIEQLREGMRIMESLGASEKDYSESFKDTINCLEELFA